MSENKKIIVSDEDKALLERMINESWKALGVTPLSEYKSIPAWISKEQLHRLENKNNYIHLYGNDKCEGISIPIRIIRLDKAESARLANTDKYEKGVEAWIGDYGSKKEDMEETPYEAGRRMGKECIDKHFHILEKAFKPLSKGTHIPFEIGQVVWCSAFRERVCTGIVEEINITSTRDPMVKSDIKIKIRCDDFDTYQSLENIFTTKDELEAHMIAEVNKKIEELK